MNIPESQLHLQSRYNNSTNHGCHQKAWNEEIFDKRQTRQVLAKVVDHNFGVQVVSWAFRNMGARETPQRQQLNSQRTLCNDRHAMRYESYTQLLKLYNDFHNNTDCITLVSVGNTYWSVKVSIGGFIAKSVWNIIKGIKSVIDIIKTKDTKTKGKFFVLVQK